MQCRPSLPVSAQDWVHTVTGKGFEVGVTRPSTMYSLCDPNSFYYYKFRIAFVVCILTDSLIFFLNMKSLKLCLCNLHV